MLLNRSVHFLDVRASIPRVEKVNAHQFDELVFNTIVAVMAHSLMYSVSIFFCRHFLFSIIPTPCLLSYFPAPMNM